MGIFQKRTFQDLLVFKAMRYALCELLRIGFYAMRHVLCDMQAFENCALWALEYYMLRYAPCAMRFAGI